MTTKQESNKQKVNELITQFNDLERFNAMNPSKEVIVVGATNLPKAIDPAVWDHLNVFHLNI
jgi:SpoVK/Ycf46/Vps4 family AAA+-type ATPase